MHEETRQMREDTGVVDVRPSEVEGMREVSGIYEPSAGEVESFVGGKA